MTATGIFAYYGADYIAMALTFASVYLLGSKNKNGFIVGSVGNVLWMAVGVVSGAYGLILVNIGITAFNVRGYIRWTKSKKS